MRARLARAIGGLAVVIALGAALAVPPALGDSYPAPPITVGPQLVSGHIEASLGTRLERISASGTTPLADLSGIGSVAAFSAQAAIGERVAVACYSQCATRYAEYSYRTDAIWGETFGGGAARCLYGLEQGANCGGSGTPDCTPPPLDPVVGSSSLDGTRAASYLPGCKVSGVVVRDLAGGPATTFPGVWKPQLAGRWLLVEKLAANVLELFDLDTGALALSERNPPGTVFTSIAVAPEGTIAWTQDSTSDSGDTYSALWASPSSPTRHPVVPAAPAELSQVRIAAGRIAVQRGALAATSRGARAGAAIEIRDLTGQRLVSQPTADNVAWDFDGQRLVLTELDCARDFILDGELGVSLPARLPRATCGAALGSGVARLRAGTLSFSMLCPAADTVGCSGAVAARFVIAGCRSCGTRNAVGSDDLALDNAQPGARFTVRLTESPAVAAWLRRRRARRARLELAFRADRGPEQTAPAVVSRSSLAVSLG